MHEGDAVLSSDGILLEWDTAREAASFSDVTDALHFLFASMRHISGQFRLASTPVVQVIGGLDDAPELPRVWPTTAAPKGSS